MSKPWNNHNHYHGEQLHDDGHYGPEPQVKCCACGASGEQSAASRCENCREWFCPACWEEQGKTWRQMEVCADCKRDLTMDHGPDPEDLPENDWRKDR